MEEKTFQQIKKLTELAGTSGAENEVANYFASQIAPSVDEVIRGRLGGVFGVRKNPEPAAPRIMVAAHLDEVGFMVVRINANGLLAVEPLGGWNPLVVSAQRFILKTKAGDYPAVSSSIPPHLLTSAPTLKAVNEVLFDAGFSTRTEAEQYGVRPGDTLVPDVATVKTANGKNIISKAWDDRFGCTAIIEALAELKESKLPNTLIAGANVQEEVGLRGSRTSAHEFQPDLFFAVDCSAADDLYGTAKTFGHLGEGFLLRIMDPGMLLSKSMREFLLDTAETHHIPYQYFVSKGNTDASAVHTMLSGIPSAVIGVAGRYIHTHQTMFSIRDYEAAREMLVQVIRALDRSTVDTILEQK